MSTLTFKISLKTKKRRLKETGSCCRPDGPHGGHLVSQRRIAPVHIGSLHEELPGCKHLRLLSFNIVYQ